MLRLNALLILAASPLALQAMNPAALVQRLKVPKGFEVSLYSGDAPSARALALGGKGTVFCGTRGPGEVYAFRDQDGDGRAEKKWTVMSGLREPIGVAFKDGNVYASAV